MNYSLYQHEPIAFAYEVTFIESDIKWSSRWNAYMKIEGAKVHCAPSNPSLFCVMVGNGVQIIGTAVVSITFSALGSTSPVSRSALVTGMLISHIFLGILAGYIAVHRWRTIFSGDHNNWISISWKVACFFPGIAFFILSLLNFLLH
ncbi:hypothetical protein L2E82_51388 [Cichorium intybus]|nr:hypothetical protein L2E82_51388 [Cichorium intybus]